MWTQFVDMDFDGALRLDALQNSHPVEVVCLFGCLFVCLVVCLFVCPFVCPFVCLCVCVLSCYHTLATSSL